MVWYGIEVRHGVGWVGMEYINLQYMVRVGRVEVGWDRVG